MSYLVVSTLDGIDRVESRHEKYGLAYVELLDRFFDYQRSCGCSEADINYFYEMIQLGEDFKRQECGVIVDDYPCFWSDVNPKHKYDIKIIDQY